MRKKLDKKNPKKKGKILTDKRDIRILPVAYAVTVNPQKPII